MSGTSVFEVGRFLLRLGPGAALRVVHADEPDRVIWDGAVAGGFLQAGRARTRVAGNTTPASGFTIRDRGLVRYAGQTVDSAELRDGALVLDGALRGADGACRYRMTWSAAGEDQLRFDVRVTGRGVNRVFLRHASDADERFWGFGQQMTHADQKGRLLPVLVQEHGVGRGKPVITQLVALKYGPRTAGNPATTEVSVPHYVSSRNRSLALETTEYCVFDLRAPDLVEIEQFAAHLTGQVLHGTTPLELVETYSGIAGRMRALPDWVHEGPIVCAQGGTAIVEGLVATLAEARIPVSAFWVQDWSGVNVTPLGNQVQWNWVLDEGHYPDWKSLRADVERLGAKIVLYVNPFLTDNAGHAQLYAEALANDYLVRDRHGAVYRILNGEFTAGLLDLTNPGAVAWIQQKITDNMIGNGAVGWMADFGEALPFDAVLHSGEDAAVVHNRYPELWAQANRDAVDAAGLGEQALFFSRSGHTRSPGISTLFWVGDQLQTWDAYDGLRSAITGCLSGGFSGFSLVHSDIGGFDSITTGIPGTGVEVQVVHRSKELLLRWAEHAAFSPVMRTHQGISAAAAWQIDQDADTLAAFGRTVALYRAWGDYRRELVAEAARTGRPVMRALALAHPDDPVAVDQQFSYQLGEAMLVAPVTDPGATRARVYLPAGSWYHPWSARTHAAHHGRWVEVDAPLGRPPVFLRTDAPRYESLRTAFDALAAR
jgi:sulfoquinovosidase